MPEFMKALLQALAMRASYAAPPSATATAQGDPWAEVFARMQSDPRYQTMMEVNALPTPDIGALASITDTAAPMETPSYLTPSAQTVPFSLRNLSRYFAGANNNP